MQRTVLSSLLVLIFIAGMMLIRVERIAEKLTAQVQHLTEEVHSLAQRVAPIGNDMSLTYPSTGGPHTTTVSLSAGESYAVGKARLDAKVAQEQAGSYPYVPPGN